jgi:hypothetical protein
MSAKDEMLTALEDFRAARAAFFEAVALPVQPPPAAASATEIAELERQLARPLPPSYRRFLETQNGWPDFDGELNMLSASEISAVRDHRGPLVLSAIARRTGIAQSENWLIFALSPDNTNSYLFDTAARDDEGEWPVIGYDEGEGIERRHDNFTEFLKAGAADSRDALEETRQGQDLLDMDF